VAGADGGRRVSETDYHKIYAELHHQLTLAESHAESAEPFSALSGTDCISAHFILDLLDQRLKARWESAGAPFPERLHPRHVKNSTGKRAAHSTFMDDLREGRVMAQDIADYVDRWHCGEGEGTALHDFLGLSRTQYQRFYLTGILPGEQERDDAAQ
jgi:hypothetical protein